MRTVHSMQWSVKFYQLSSLLARESSRTIQLDVVIAAVAWTVACMRDGDGSNGSTKFGLPRARVSRSQLAMPVLALAVPLLPLAGPSVPRRVFNVLGETSTENLATFANHDV